MTYFKSKPIYQLDKDEIYSTAISPDEKYIAIGGKRGKIYIIDGKSYNLITTLTAYNCTNDTIFPIEYLRFSPDGKYLYGSPKFDELNLNVKGTSIWDTSNWLMYKQYDGKVLSTNNRIIDLKNEFAISFRLDLVNVAGEVKELESNNWKIAQNYGFSFDDKYIFALRDGKLYAYNYSEKKLATIYDSKDLFTYLAISNVSNTLMLRTDSRQFVVLKYDENSGIIDFNEVQNTMNAIMLNKDEVLTINLINPTEDLKYRLFDNIGREIQLNASVNLIDNKLNLNLSELTPGIYHLSVVCNNKIEKYQLLLK